MTSLPLLVNVAGFVVGAAIVWRAGSRLVTLADAVADRSGLGQAFIGALLLGGATSLPEIATTLSAAGLGNAELAASNLMGGVAMQITVLAGIDLVLVRGALTFFTPKPVLLLGGVLLIMQLALAQAAIASGDLQLLPGVGAWPLALFAVYLASLYFLQRYEGKQRWIPADLPDERSGQRDASSDPAAQSGRQAPDSSVALAMKLALMCLLVLAGGYAVARAADALTAQTGVSGTFVGATLVAIATSLPEVSTTTAAVRKGAYTLAVANIFGTNSLEVALLFPADLVLRGTMIIEAVGRPVLLIGAFAIAVTSLYLWGLLERRDRTVAGMGVDSALVLITYAVGLVLLYLVSS